MNPYLSADGETDVVEKQPLDVVESLYGTEITTYIRTLLGGEAPLEITTNPNLHKPEKGKPCYVLTGPNDFKFQVRGWNGVHRGGGHDVFVFFGFEIQSELPGGVICGVHYFAEDVPIRQSIKSAKRRFDDDSPEDSKMLFGGAPQKIIYSGRFFR